MIAEGAAIFSSIKNAIDIAKGVQQKISDGETKKELSSLLDKLISFQTEEAIFRETYRSLQDKYNLLEAEIIKIKQFESEKLNYEFHQPRQGVFVYLKKENCGSSEPKHWICPQCYMNSKKSVLQFTKRSGMTNASQCSVCDAVFEATL